MTDFGFYSLEDGPPPSPDIDPTLELNLLRHLERKMRAMFAFTGWDENIDQDAQRAVNAVELALDDLAAARRIIRAAHSAEPSRQPTE